MSRTIAILGGTGAEGSGLALRFAHAGARVLIGSRSLARSQEVSRRIHPAALGLLNPDAAGQAEIVILTAPIQAQIATLKSVRASLRPGTVLVDATVPMEIAIGGRLSHPLALWAGSAAEQAARNVPEGVAVVSAFHSLSAELLGVLDATIESDVLI
ncbi:MAG: NAD(P)-binding domain-containing protein, partial [Bryobacteraceae bacterium]